MLAGLQNLIGSIPFHFLSGSYRQSLREKNYLIYIDTLVYFIIKYLLEFSFIERTVFYRKLSHCK